MQIAIFIVNMWLGHGGPWKHIRHAAELPSSGRASGNQNSLAPGACLLRADAWHDLGGVPLAAPSQA